MSDIQIEGGEWLPIGNCENSSNYVAFGGVFDGGGHTVSGIAIGSQEEPVTYGYQGFFGYVRGAYIHDLVVEGEVVANGKSASSGGDAIGGLVGGGFYANDELYTSNNVGATTIERCGSRVDVTGRYAVGGIIGSAQGTGEDDAYVQGSAANPLTAAVDRRAGGLGQLAVTTWRSRGPSSAKTTRT